MRMFRIAPTVILAVGAGLAGGCVMTPPNCDQMTSTQRLRCLDDREQVERINADLARARKARQEGHPAGEKQPGADH
jgi:hypothetical protein